MSKDKRKRLDEKVFRRLAKVFKSLSEPLRLEILGILIREGKTSVSSICEQLGGESQPAISHHLTQLKNAELVSFQREGKYNYYYISPDVIEELLSFFFPGHHKSIQTFDFGNLLISFRTRSLGSKTSTHV